MAGDQELLRLAQLLRLCAETAIAIAKIRSAADESEIGELVEFVTVVADEFQRLVDQPKDTSNLDVTRDPRFAS